MFDVKKTLYFVITFILQSLCFKSQWQSVTINFGISEVCDQNGDRVSKSDKSLILDKKRISPKYENMGLCLYIFLIFQMLGGVIFLKAGRPLTVVL